MPEHRLIDLHMKNTCSSQGKLRREKEFLRTVFYLVENKPDGNSEQTWATVSYYIYPSKNAS